MQKNFFESVNSGTHKIFLRLTYILLVSHIDIGNIFVFKI